MNASAHGSVDPYPSLTLGSRWSGDLLTGRSFDVIVVGSGMGGLSVASLLAQRDLRVLLLEQNDVVGGCVQSYQRRGYRFNVGMHYIGSVNAPTMTRRLFDAVTGGQVRWHDLPDVYNRMVIGDGHYEVPAGREAYRNMLGERFPAEGEAIDAYLDLVAQVPKTAAAFFAQKALPVDSVDPTWSESFHRFSDQTTAEALSALTANEELMAVWTANWGDYSLPPSRSSFAMHCMLNKHYLNGASYPEGGAMAFAAAIEPIVASAGGLVVRGAAVEQILVEAGRCIGVQMSDGSEIRAPHVVSNAGIQNTFGRLVSSEAATAAGLDVALDEVADSYALVGLNLGMRGDAESLGLRSANIWAHPSPDFDRHIADHEADFEAPFPFTFTTFPSTKDPLWGERYPNRSTIEMYAYSDYRHFESWSGTTSGVRPADYEECKQQIGRRLLAELDRLLPGVTDAVEVSEVSTPLTYERFLRRRRGGFMGVEASPERFRAAALRAPTPIEGLFLSGQDVTTDGVIGALTGGVIAASALLGTDLMTEIARPPIP